MLLSHSVEGNVHNEEVVVFIISKVLLFNFHRVVVKFLLVRSHVTCMKMN